MTAPNTGCEAAEQRIQELEKQLEAAEAKLHDRRRRAGKKWNGKFRKGDRVYVILNGFRFNGTVIKHKRKEAPGDH